MKIICESADLSHAMAIVTRALANKPLMPILEGVYIQTQDNAIRLCCTDLKMGIECFVPAEVLQPGETVLHGKLFAEVARHLPEGSVTLCAQEQEGGDSGAQLHAAGIHTRLFVMDAAEFPELPRVENAKTVRLQAAVLRSLIGQCVFAAAVDESRPILTGALMELKGGALTMVALDGFRLALCSAPYEGESEEISAVIPAVALTRLSAILEGEEWIDLEISQTHAGVLAGTTRMVCRLLEGDFIDYAHIIPTQWVTRLTVARPDMLQALERAAMLAREGANNLVKFSVSGEGVKIASNSERGEIDESLRASVEGNELNIAFNVRYLMEVFRNITQGDVMMEFTSPVSPCVVRPAQGPSKYLVLPVRLPG